MTPSAENPFEPRRDGAALVLTLDGKSLSTSAEIVEPRDFLLELTATPDVDALALDTSPGLRLEGSRGYLADPDLDRDSRTIAQTGSSGGFFGSVQPWSSRERQADELGLSGAGREWLLYYEAVTWFHRNSGRHFFVTADPRLLRQLRAPSTAARWRDRRIVDITQALRYLGLLMISRDKLYLEARGGYTRARSAYDLYFELSHALAPARVRLHRWIDTAPPGVAHGELADLEQSVFARVMDLLRARDHIALLPCEPSRTGQRLTRRCTTSGRRC